MSKCRIISCFPDVIQLSGNIWSSELVPYLVKQLYMSSEFAWNGTVIVMLSNRGIFKLKNDTSHFLGRCSYRQSPYEPEGRVELLFERKTFDSSFCTLYTQYLILRSQNIVPSINTDLQRTSESRVQCNLRDTKYWSGTYNWTEACTGVQLKPSFRDMPHYSNAEKSCTILIWEPRLV